MLLLAAAGAAVLCAQSMRRSPLSPLAQAYSELGHGLTQAGLLPFATDDTTLQQTLETQRQHGLKVVPTTTDTGQPVYQVGSVLTVITQDGRVTRYLLTPANWSEQSGTPLGTALHHLAGLSLSSQHPVQLQNTASVPIYEQNFFFEYSQSGHTWRLTPQFEAQRCVRVDVEQE